MYLLFSNREETIIVYVEVSVTGFECILTRNDMVITYTTHQSRLERGSYLFHGLE